MYIRAVIYGQGFHNLCNRKLYDAGILKLMYSHLSNSRGGWNKRGGGAKVAKSINVEVGITVEVGIFLKNQ